MRESIKSERGRLRRSIVVGAGRAGLAATLELVERGVPVLLMSAGPSQQAQSARDREGFNACELASRDSAEQHVADTRAAGHELVSEQVLGRLCMAAPKLVDWLANLGVPFTRQAGGMLLRAELRGSCWPRTAHVQASTGRHLISVLDALVRTLESAPVTDAAGLSVAGEKVVRRLEYWRFVSLVLDDHGSAVGVLAQDCRSLTFKAFPADGVVLATGDYAGLFAESAANSTCLGAALGAVYRQGAVLSNLEFVEQHPLVVVRPGASVALPELLRARGARLVGAKGSAAQNLDLTGLDPDTLATLNASLGPALVKLIGVELSREPIPVELRASRGLGGLWVDSSATGAGKGFSPREHATSIAGLYAAGAADAQYHGAAALPGNLAPADVFGGQLAARGVVCFRESLAKSACDLPNSVFDKPASQAEEGFEALLRRDSTEAALTPHELLLELRTQMARWCGAARSAEGLEELSEQLVKLQEQAQRVSVRGRSSGCNPDAVLAASLDDALALARAVVSSASWREESRGSHQRSDFGAADETYKQASFTRASSGLEPENLMSFDAASAVHNASMAK